MRNLLAGNPCGDAARSELEAGASAEGDDAQMQVILRALSTLMSDDCEASDIQPADEAQTPSAQLEEVEEELQDAIDEIMDSEEEGEAFIQLDQAGIFRRFMRGVGVFFLMLFLLLACVGAAAMIGVALAVAVTFLLAGIGMLTNPYQSNIGGMQLVIASATGSWLGAVVGLAGCAHQLYNSVLPKLSQ